ncbi:MAG: hypothetical protein GXP62_12730 [Oligoflexia bacterium]|nr:hypothetical protein [Oligoflexia bacterium]
MPLTYDEYSCLKDFSVLYSGGLDSVAVAIYLGLVCQGRAHLLTYEHRYGAFFNEWSRRHNADLDRVLGPNAYEHHLIDLTAVWNEVGFKKMIRDALHYRGHWVCCLGCQQSMAAHTILHSLENNVTNAFICSSVGGEYAVMSMGVTRQKNIENYARYGIRYNAPLLDLGINKNEERRILKEHDVEPGWGRRRSHQGFQPICVLGFQHALDIVVDFHTTYPPDRVGAFLDDKFEIMDRVIRAALQAKGHDPDQLIDRNLAKYDQEEADLATFRASRPRN